MTIHKLVRLDYNLGDNYFIDITDFDGHKVTWALYMDNVRYINSESTPIMTSDTHTDKDLIRYVKTHRVFDTSYVINAISWILIVSMWISTLMRNILNHDFSKYIQGIWLGLFTAWGVVIITYLITDLKNHKSETLYCKEKLDKKLNDWENKYNEK